MHGHQNVKFGQGVGLLHTDTGDVSISLSMKWKEDSPSVTPVGS